MKTYTCTHCESDNVYRQRIAYWSNTDQAWLDEPFADEFYCADCATIGVEEKEMNQ